MNTSSYFRRNLPHYHIEGAEYFITFRLVGTLPSHVFQNFEENTELPFQKTEIEKRKQAFIQKIIDEKQYGPTWLENPEIANLLMDAMHYRDGNVYQLYAFCIMSNHVHMVIRHYDSSVAHHKNLSQILHSLKLYTAGRANKILDRSGQFWLHESYDHIIRSDDELADSISYTLNNPVIIGLVEHWNEWPYNYCIPEYSDL